MATKQDCSLFALGTHQKKRPDNLILGRTFASHLLDMFEFGVTNYASIQSFSSSEINNDLKPIIVFQGEQFEFSDKHKRLKNFLLDFFKQTDLHETNIAEMKRILLFTSTTEHTILCRHYEVNRGKKVNETDVKNKSFKFNEIGPHFDLTIRRDKIGAADLWKNACKHPKLMSAATKRLRKNVSTDEFGQKLGKVFLQSQQLKTLNLRKFKAQKISRKREATDAKAAKNAPAEAQDL